jgi:hypothetical protein
MTAKKVATKKVAAKRITTNTEPDNDGDDSVSSTPTRSSTLSGAEVLAALENDPDYLADSSIVSVQEVGPKEVLVVLDDDEFHSHTFRCHPNTDLNAVLDQIRNPLPPAK